MKRYAIIGYPVSHSLSPQIHNPAFKQLNIDAHYEKIEIAPKHFEQIIAILKKENIYSGFNITVPFKEKIIPFLDRIDPLAEKVGAVNTVQIIDGEWIGHNTDLFGFIEPIKDQIGTYKSALVLGAGGAAKAVLFSLAALGHFNKITIHNRTKGRAEQLAQQLKQHFSEQEVAIYKQDDVNNTYDIIINCTSIGMEKTIEQNPYNGMASHHNKSFFYDLIYKPEQTQFLSQATELKLNNINGLEMLKAQAAKSFFIWTGQNFPE